MSIGKKYKESAALIEKSKLYDPAEAVALACQTAKAKFDETIELHIRLGVDSRHADQQVRGAIVLPNGTGKTVRTLVFARGDKAKAAEDAGADYVGADDLVTKIQGGWFDFDVVIASPDMMGLVGRLGKGTPNYSISVYNDDDSGAQDKYAEMFDALDTAFGNTATVDFFAYDWRKSCVDAADELSDYLDNYSGNIYLVARIFSRTDWSPISA